jgi:ribonuclease P protein component
VIARDDRLRRNDEFSRVRSQGRSYSARNIVVVVLPNDLGTTRYGFAAGKRLGNAVRRNRAKRLMREAIRAEQASIASGFDIVVIARNAFPPDLKLSDISSQLGGLLDKAGLRSNPTSSVRTGAREDRR